MNTNLESKINIEIPPAGYIEYDVSKLRQTITYFCYHHLKHIDPNELPNIFIEIETGQGFSSIMDCGATRVLDKDSVKILISIDNIYEQTGFHFWQSPLKSLFHVFLHEFHHLLVLVDLYLQREKETTLLDIAERKYIESQKELESLKKWKLSLGELCFNLDEEQDCEWFAFQNVALLESLYEHDFLYLPKKAFMAEVKKGS